MGMKFGLLLAACALAWAQENVLTRPAENAPATMNRMIGRIVLQDGSKPPFPPSVSGSCGVAMSGWSSFTVAAPWTDHAEQHACWVLVSLAGYRSVRGPVEDDMVVVLKRLGESEGSTVSLTVLKAPEKARKAYGKGGQAVWKKDWAAAQKWYEDAVALYPEYATAWDELGLALERQGKREEASAA